METQQSIDKHLEECFEARAKLPKGAWSDEPDRINWNSSGLDCMLVRNPSSFAWCGYVGVPARHPLFGLKYSDESSLLARHHAWLMTRRLGAVEQTPARMIGMLSGRIKMSPDSVFEVHGGLTYSQECHGAICHVSDRDVWWFGFDCGHGGDYMPMMEYTMSQLKSKGLNPSIWAQDSPYGKNHYWTMAEVRQETQKLAAQLALYRRTNFWRRLLRWIDG